MDVYKNLSYEAFVTVKLVDSLYHGQEMSQELADGWNLGYACTYDTKTYDNGKIVVPSFLLEPIAITKENAIEELDKIAETERNKDVDFLHYKLLKDLFKEQRDLLMDDAQYRKQIVICGRRAGKTYSNARRLVWTCIKPNSPCLYMNLNFTNAINQMWDEVQKCIEEVGLRVKSQSKAEGTVEFQRFFYHVPWKQQ